MNTTQKPVNLATVKGMRAAFDEDPKMQNLADYLTSGTPELVYNKKIIVNSQCDDYIGNEKIFVIDKGLVCYHRISYTLGALYGVIREGKFQSGRELHGVIVPQKFGDNKALFIANGDEDRNYLVDFATNQKSFPTLSFQCFRRFFFENDVYKSISLLVSGKVKVLDVRPDETIEMTAKELKEYERKGLDYKYVPKYHPPQAGFTVVYPGKWHRPATLLVYHSESRRTIIFGQDEGSYFGCEVPGYPKTISDAFEALIPKELRGRKDLRRQGEWFFAPISKKAVPPVEKSLVTYVESFCLPVENEDSKSHVVDCSKMRLTKDGRIYVCDPAVSHEDHDTLDLEGWYTVHRNLAKQSFSEQGVD